MSYQDLEITPAEVAEKQGGPTPPILLDVREDWEWEYNRIPGARHLPLGQLEARHKELEPSAEIVVYCHHGMRSFQAAMWLHQNGFTKVKSLAGGIDRWADDVSPDMPRY